MTEVQRVLELLAPIRRRYALYYLDSSEDPVEVSELAEAVAETESGERRVTDEN